jgi:hypothetical protein
MAIRTGAAHVAAAVSLATLLFVPIAALARSGGAGVGARHSFFGSPFVQRHLMQRHRAFNAFPYGGYVGGTLSSASYSESDIPLLQAREFPPEPLRALTCHRSRETMAVPVEGGGEQQVRVTRC